jgi:hypothetical protein
MNSSAQLPLPNLRDARWRPLADTDGVKWALDISSEEVEHLIDLGFVVAFNIAVEGRVGRREFRFLTRSIEHYRATLGSRRLDLSWAQIFRLIVPHEKPVIIGTEIDAALNCDPDHRQNLIRADRLKIVDGTRWRPGRNGAPVVTRASFETFLKGRQL